MDYLYYYFLFGFSPRPSDQPGHLNNSDPILSSHD
nr:MAG TPA: hypothetical protein [Caudoviricetes sp.]